MSDKIKVSITECMDGTLKVWRNNDVCIFNVTRIEGIERPNWGSGMYQLFMYVKDALIAVWTVEEFEDGKRYVRFI